MGGEVRMDDLTLYVSMELTSCGRFVCIAGVLFAEENGLQRMPLVGKQTLNQPIPKVVDIAISVLIGGTQTLMRPVSLPSRHALVLVNSVT